MNQKTSPILSVFIRKEGTSHLNGELRQEAVKIIDAIKAKHVLTDNQSAADLSIDHLALGAPKNEEGLLDWSVAEVILESEQIIENLPISRVKFNNA